MKGVRGAVTISTKLRILKALSWQGWLSSGQLKEQFGAGQGTMLRKCINDGLVERRGAQGWYEYAITESGRAELSRSRRSE